MQSNRARTAALLAGVSGSGFDRAVALGEESLRAYRQLGDSTGIAHAQAIIAYLLAFRGDTTRARAMAAEAIASARSVDDRHVLVRVVALAAYYDGVIDDLREVLAEESLNLARQDGDLLAIALLQRILGALALRRGDYDQARRAFREDLMITRQLGYTFEVTSALQHLGDVATLEGNFAEAAALYRETAEICVDNGHADSSMHVNVLQRLGYAILQEGDVAGAAALFRRCLATHQAINKRTGIRLCLIGLALVAARQSQTERAVTLAAAARTLSGVDERPWESAEIGRVTSYGQANLPATAFATTWQRGQDTLLADVIAFALCED